MHTGDYYWSRILHLHTMNDKPLLTEVHDFTHSNMQLSLAIMSHYTHVHSASLHIAPSLLPTVMHYLQLISATV